MRAIRCIILMLIAFGTPTAVLHYRMQYVSSTLLNITERVIIPLIGRLVIITMLILYTIIEGSDIEKIFFHFQFAYTVRIDRAQLLWKKTKWCVGYPYGYKDRKH